MTRAEFDKWITKHYGELLAVARRLVNRDPEDIVQQAVLRVVSARSYTRAKAIWTFMVNNIRSAASNARRGDARARGVPESISAGRGEGLNRHLLRRLPPAKDAERYADRLYLKKLEQDREVFDMDGWGRTDAPFNPDYAGRGKDIPDEALDARSRRATGGKA